MLPFSKILLTRNLPHAFDDYLKKKKKAQANSDGLINWLPASPFPSRQIRYIMTKASRDTVGSPDYFVISPQSLCE